MNAGDMPPRNLFNKADWGGGLFSRCETLVERLERTAAATEQQHLKAKGADERRWLEVAQMAHEMRGGLHRCEVLAERQQETIEALLRAIDAIGAR